MKKYKVAVGWEMYGVVEIEATSIEEAIKIAKEKEDEFDLPEGEYVDGSFFIEEDVDVNKLINNISAQFVEFDEFGELKFTEKETKNSLSIERNNISRTVTIFDKDDRSMVPYILETDLKDRTIHCIVDTLQNVDCYNFEMLLNALKLLGARVIESKTSFYY